METSGPFDDPPQTPIKSSRPPSVRRFLRFSLRGLLLLILVLSIWLAWQVNRAHKQRRALAKIYELGGSVIFDYQVIESKSHEAALHWDPKKEPSAPKWLRTLVGEEYFREVIAIDLDKTPTRDEDMWILDDLRKVEWLWLGETQITDLGIEQIARAVPHLKGLGLDNTRLTDRGMAPLGRLRDLHQLLLWKVSIGDEAMQFLSPLTKMRQLILDGTKITDAGLVHLENMHDIDEWLGLCCAGVSDDGLKHLTHLKKAKSINLLNSRVTSKGGYWLSEQLPNCDVSFPR